MSSLYWRPAIDASCLVSVHLAGRFQRRRFLKNWSIRKNCLWRPCLLMDRDKMSILYNGPSIDASYQVSVHLAEGVSEEKIKIWKGNGRRMPSYLISTSWKTLIIYVPGSFLYECLFESKLIWCITYTVWSKPLTNYAYTEFYNTRDKL